MMMTMTAKCMVLMQKTKKLLTITEMKKNESDNKEIARRNKTFFGAMSWTDVIDLIV